jgi:S1-C subfamily serine protease
MSMRAVAALAVALLAGCGSNGPEQPTLLDVTVPTETPSGEHATAWAIGGGRALTVAHVLRTGHPVLAAERRANVVRVDRRLDVAVLAVPDLGGREPALGEARAGDRVIVRVLRDGAARSLPATVRRVITARLTGNGPVEVRPALELAVAVAPGDSGAPVIDARRRVAGVVFAQASDRDLTYALDARALPSP